MSLEEKLDAKLFRIQYKPHADDVWRNVAGLTKPLSWFQARAILDQVKDDVAAIRVLQSHKVVWLREAGQTEREVPKEL